MDNSEHEFPEVGGNFGSCAFVNDSNDEQNTTDTHEVNFSLTIYSGQCVLS